MSSYIVIFILGGLVGVVAAEVDDSSEYVLPWGLIVGCFVGIPLSVLVWGLLT